MSEVMMIPFVDHYGDLEVDQVALFDRRDLTEEEAKKMIHSGQVEYTNKMVVMSKKQYETVFRSLKDKHSDEIRNAYDEDGEPLPPCPFCGMQHILFVKYQHAAGPRWKVMCADCLAEIDPGWAQQTYALIPMWKRRAADNRIHAKWIDASAKRNCGKKCSHCGSRITNREYVAGTHPFCHKCGAVMDNATEIQDEIRRRM